MMPPKRKEVSSTTSEQTGRQTRTSSRVVSSASATAQSASSSRSTNTSSDVESSRRTTRARPASQTATSSRNNQAEPTSQSPTSSADSRITRNGRSASAVSGNVRSRRTASSSSQSPTRSSSVSRTQSASTSTTEAEDGAIGGGTTRAGPRIPVSSAAQARSASATSSSNGREDTSAREGPSPVGVHPHSPGELPLPDWDTTVDLTSPDRPSITRAGFNPIMRRLSESLLQQDQGDITHDFSELTFTSPPTTPPRNAHIGEWSPRPNRSIFVDDLQPVTPPHRNNHMDITIDLTDSPAPAPAASASPEGNTLDPAPGSTSHIKCPVCLDDLPQISSTRRNLMSTVCGHVFCSSCLPLCIRSNGRCPSCRKLLNPNQIHPIFL